MNVEILNMQKTRLGLVVFTLLLSMTVYGCSSERSSPPKINLFDAIGEGDIVAVQQHLNAGTKTEQWIPDGYPWAGASPLHLAVVLGNQNIIQLLLDNGASIDVKAKDQPGGTPLQWAAFFAKLDITKLLVTAGADINAKDNNGCTPLCATTVENPFVPKEDLEYHKKKLTTIQGFLKGNGAR